MTDRATWEARHAARPPRAAPSPFVVDHVARLAREGRAGRALDVACGSGRHAAVLAAHGFRTVALDVAPAACRRVAEEIAGVHPVVGDAAAPPFAPRTFAVVVQTFFLDRDAFPRLVDLLLPGGALIVETFLRAQHESTGHPRLEFCLAPGELVHLCGAGTARMHVVAAREGRVERGDEAVHLASLVAVRSL